MQTAKLKPWEMFEPQQPQQKPWEMFESESDRAIRLMPAGFEFEDGPEQTPAPNQNAPQLPPGFEWEDASPQAAKADMLPLPASPGETAVDIGKGLLAGVGNGVAGTVGLPVDLFNLSNDQRIKQDNAQIESLSPEQQAEMIAALKQNKSPLLRGMDIDKIFQPKAPHQNLPGGSSDIQGFINENVPGADFEAQTTPGKLAQTGTEFAASALTGGLPALTRTALPKIAAAGLTAGVASEAAGQATQGTAAELPARIAGGFVGGFTPLAATTKKLAGNANARNLIRQRLGDGVTDADFDKAAAIQRAAKEQGIDLTGPESLDLPQLDGLESATRQSSTGGSALQGFLQGRKLQVNRALKQNFGSIAPGGLDPRLVGVQANSAANASLKAARKERSNATRPFFQAAEQDIATPSIVQSLKNDISKIKAPAGHPLSEAKQQFSKMLGGTGNSAVETNIGQLDETYKFWRERLTFKPDSPPEQKALVARLSPIVKRLGKLIENESSNIAAGRRVHKFITKNLVGPLEQSGMTEIAKAKTFKSVTNILTNPELARPKQVHSLLQNLGRQSPDLPAKILRVHLENSLNRAGKRLQSGQPNIGANFYKQVYNSDNSTAIMAAFFGAVERQAKVKTGSLFKGFNKTMRVLERVGRINGGGSQTQPLQEIKREASKPGFVGQAAEAVNILKGGPLAQIKEFSTTMATEKTYEALASIFTNPNSVSLIQRIGKSKEVMAPATIAAINTLLQNARQAANQSAETR